MTGLMFNPELPKVVGGALDRLKMIKTLSISLKQDLNTLQHRIPLDSSKPILSVLEWNILSSN